MGSDLAIEAVVGCNTWLIGIYSDMKIHEVYKGITVIAVTLPHDASVFVCGRWVPLDPKIQQSEV